ncbi:MFS general substrate transporter [Cylindrobasidium torrendii FP15055 ss-10]|uniref:MFS general substrate transporter n=1 Tax=Cylindrobasidium torrendii FP15055 ss-10 TaxID=1314674 RepID=A0A0D7BPA5_9AGAR|nr:MFS general substrate transporter [Cylindrobasidium torrendii FP15055 ss-10]
MTDTGSSFHVPTTNGQDDPVLDREKHQSFQADQAFVEDYPDGGLRAWLVIAGAAASTFSTFGYINAWGSFQSYYQKTLLVDSDASTIAWIGSIQYALILLPGLLTGRMFDLGYFQLPNFIASVVLVVATFLIAECTKYWHFLLCQGIAVGLACGIIFGPTMGVVGHWFKHRRGIALGVTACGSSLGGTVFPIIASKLIPLIGFPWTVRTIGFILVVACGFSNLAMKRRLPPKNVEGGLLNLASFKNPCYSIYTASSLAAFLGLYTLLTYIDVSATFYGVSPTISFYLLSIANFSSGFGRIVTGVVSGRTGVVNFIVPMTFIAGVLTYAWPFAHSFGTMVVIAILYGFSSGAYISSFMLPLFEMGEIGDIGRRTGMVLSIAALGAVAGPPISGAINTATGGYNAVGYYAGSTIMLAVILMLITRHLALRKKFVGKY